MTDVLFFIAFTAPYVLPSLSDYVLFCEGRNYGAGLEGGKSLILKYHFISAICLIITWAPQER
jgi:hypothetical protein